VSEELDRKDVEEHHQAAVRALAMKREPSRDSLIDILLPLALIFGLVLLLSVSRTSHQGNVADQSTGDMAQAARWLFTAGAEIAAAPSVAQSYAALAHIYAVFSRSKQHVDSTSNSN